MFVRAGEMGPKMERKEQMGNSNPSVAAAMMMMTTIIINRIILGQEVYFKKLIALIELSLATHLVFVRTTFLIYLDILFKSTCNLTICTTNIITFRPFPRSPLIYKLAAEKGLFVAGSLFNLVYSKK